MPRTLYRVVRSWPPAVEDFRSNAEKGLPRRGPEITMPELATGLSMFDDPAPLRRRIEQGILRGLICEVVIPDEAPVRVQKTLSRGHYTVWGDPNVLLGYARRPPDTAVE